MHDLVEADLWDQIPDDLLDLLALLPRTDLYLQSEMQMALLFSFSHIEAHIYVLWKKSAYAHRL